MHPDLEALLTLQAKDQDVTRSEQALEALEPDVRRLDEQMTAAERVLEAARRSIEDAVRAPRRARGQDRELPHDAGAAAPAAGVGARREGSLDPHGRARSRPLRARQRGSGIHALGRRGAGGGAQSRRGREGAGSGPRSAGGRPRSRWRVAARRSWPSWNGRARLRTEATHGVNGVAAGAATSAFGAARRRSPCTRCTAMPVATASRRYPTQRRVLIQRGASIEACEACGVLLYGAE